ncbi:hypothetical protein DRW03_15575 [Corallococcus sp. H22C18031201]|nr:hypothetical protein DRW03_15575 [Corallococcus sp. H22C18031201]
MKSRLSRFLNLERERPERGAPQASSLESSGRFEALSEREAVAGETGVPEAHLERFKGQEPLALTDEEEALDFPRCVRCESENGRFAATCGVCGADLGSPEQQAANTERWKAQREAREAERASAQAGGLARADAERREEAERYGRMLDELRAEERASSRWSRMGEHTTVGTALLSLIPDPRVRWGTVVVVGLGALWMAGHGPMSVRSIGRALSFLLLLLFLPRRSIGGWRR